MNTIGILLKNGSVRDEAGRIHKLPDLGKTSRGERLMMIADCRQGGSSPLFRQPVGPFAGNWCRVVRRDDDNRVLHLEIHPDKPVSRKEPLSVDPSSLLHGERMARLTSFFLEDRYTIPRLRLELTPGNPSPELDRELEKRGCTRYVFLTTTNEIGHIHPYRKNEARHEFLREFLHGMPHFEGTVHHPKDRCPPYRGFLVFGIDPEVAMQHAVNLRQLAFLSGEIGSAPGVTFTPVASGAILTAQNDRLSRWFGTTPELWQRVHQARAGATVVIPFS